MRLFAQNFDTLRELYVNELRDLYSAETQLVDALPKMAEAATSPLLKDAFAKHLVETQVHARRLEQILSNLSEKPTGETCEAMRGLIKEGEGYVKASGDPDVRDAGLIGAAQRVEHYEMAGYGTVRSLAKKVGDFSAVELLQETLNEEGAADEKLTQIAEGSVNDDAATGRSATGTPIDTTIFPNP